LVLSAFALSTAQADAAGPPLIPESWVTGVTASGATLRALINPNGSFTTYRFEYITEAAYEANLKAAHEGFTGAQKIPAEGQPAGLLGSGTTALEVSKAASGLSPATSYRYRVVATNAQGPPTIGPEHVLATQESSLVFHLPDNRGWELVSPPDKGGGSIAVPGALFGGGEFQAAAGGGSVTYSSASAFHDPKGAPPASQYLSTRTSSGWSTQNLSTPLESAAYGPEPDGAPYRLFSEDLSRALLLEGQRCFAEGTCPPPFAQWQGGSLSSVPAKAGLYFEGASPDLHHFVFSADDGLYEWSGGALQQLSPTAGAALAAPASAISEDGSRIYFTLTGNLYLRESAQTIQVDESLGGGGAFQGASADGSLSFFTKGKHLYRFKASTKAITDLTPSGGVKGVLGTSADGTTTYYQDAAGIKRWHEGTTTQVAAGATAALPSDYEPPTIGTARVTADGSHLAFLSTGELSDYDNAGKTEAYLYGPPLGGGAPLLRCASCNPTGERARGSAQIPGALINGSTSSYLPRALSSDGERLFFTSSDDLVVQDTNDQPDVYQWEAVGKGDCNRSLGCISLISSGRSPEGATFIDASEDGSDAFFTTDASLVGEDPAAVDLYDARIGGGFPEAPKPIACVADACQSLPAPPEDPDPGTLIKSSGNPSPSFEAEKAKKKKHRHHHRRHKGGRRR
jgi:hypothetical protein